MCRICYENEEADLFAPCRCAGSMRFVHRECLRRWRAVSVGERGFSYCPMCGFKYLLTDDASLPPTSSLHTLLRTLAVSSRRRRRLLTKQCADAPRLTLDRMQVGECAVLATLLCLATALGGEALEFLTARAPAAA